MFPNKMSGSEEGGDKKEMMMRFAKKDGKKGHKRGKRKSKRS